MTGFPDRLPERFTESIQYEETIRVLFPNGEHLLLQMAANATLLIVSSTGKVRFHMCENGSMTVMPQEVFSFSETHQPG
jgi:hypothetical protein